MKNMEGRILIIEDEERMRHLLELLLVEQGYFVKTARDGVEGMSQWKLMQPDVVLTDLKMPRADGLEVLEFRNRQFQQVPLIILTAFGTVECAVTAMKQGAYDYLTKPFDNDHLVAVVASAKAGTEKKQGAVEGSEMKPGQMIGTSLVMQKVYEDIAMISRTRMSVLVSGESGTGKELVAKAIHANPEQPIRPFVRVNCAAIPHDLLESELFGHLRGAFTGAVSDRQGAFIQADGGTLFLDEIGDLPLQLQPKLLHAVEEKTVTPVGAATAQKVDVMIIAATNHDLDEMVHSGLFRNDLYQRLNRFPLHLPPLRHRGKDLLELINYFLELFCREQEKRVLTVSAEAFKLLHSYSWPGNIRELRNVLERIVLTCRNGIITAKMLPKKAQFQNLVTFENIRESLNLPAQEQQLIISALEQCGWNQSESARKLGVSRNTLRYRMKKYDINRIT